jgi:hypothetical protein
MSFDSDFGSVLSGAAAPAAKSMAAKDKGEKRPWLHVYETLPAQLLNAYGPAKFAKIAPELAWEGMTQPLKSGAMYMTEMASLERERRGVGMNRTWHGLVLYCKYQLDPTTRLKNEALLCPTKCKELYEEIDVMLPVFEYLLAPKKGKTPSGASMLRSSQEDAVATVAKDPALLKSHSKKAYEWLSPTAPSRIRMLIHWQAAGGMSFVAATHHLGCSLFILYGGKFHEGHGDSVSLEDFQSCVIARHSADGMAAAAEGDAANVDFA